MTAADFAQIHQLNARYCHTVDFGDFPGVASCFASDGRFELVGRPEGPANRRGADMPFSPSVLIGRGHGRHITIGEMIDGDGVTARAFAPMGGCRDYGPPVGKGQIAHATLGGGGFYLDDYVKIDGRWVYKHRRQMALGSPAALARVGEPLDIAPVDAGASQGGMTGLDHEAIRHLLVKCNLALDLLDFTSFADCYTPDGSYHEVAGTEVNSGVTAVGREQLFGFAVSVGQRGYRGMVRHSVLNPLIEGDGEWARVSSYGLVTIAFDAAPQAARLENGAVLTTGLYRDEVVKVEGRWLIAKRTFCKDTLPDVARLIGEPLQLSLFGESSSAPAAREGGDSNDDLIRQLFARFSQTLDLGDSHGFAACFAEAGLLDTSAPGEGLTGVHQGAHELRSFASGALEYSAGRVRHFVVDPLIEVDGTTATATSNVLVTRAYDSLTAARGLPSDDTRSVLETCGMFFDELVKVDRQWVFSRRQFRHAGMPEVAERVMTPVTIGPREGVVA
jgi:hypothetical protein